MASLDVPPSIPKRLSSNPSLRRPPVVPQTLTSSQLHALFDILTHYETYAEVELFKQPKTITGYGYPFSLRRDADGTPVYATEYTAPLLASLLRSIVMPIPGVRDLPPEFWHVRFQGVLKQLSEVELSESYDKGSLGVRKTLATAASAIHESVSRGILGGVPRGLRRDLNGYYDRSKASELQRAWDDVVHELTYGNLVDDLFDAATRSAKLDDLPPAVVAAIDYATIHVATFMHHVFVLSSQGPYIVKLLERVHNLVPYAAIRQILRIGNVASMLNGLTKLLLAKVGVSVVTNWMGLTRNADEGLNLLQWIIEAVLSADSAEFRKAIQEIETVEGGPSKATLFRIKDYILRPREVHETTRRTSRREPTSIIAAIPGISAKDFSHEEQIHCLEYLSANLAVRDRVQITKALCRQNPDHFTQAVRDVVASFESIIRSVHEKVDLRDHVTAFENILADFINTSKPKPSPARISSPQPASPEGDGGSGLTRAPSIEDYVGFLTRSRQLVYNFVHDILSKSPEVGVLFREYAKQVSKVFSSGQTQPLQAQPPHQQERSSSTGSYVTALEEIQIELTNKLGEPEEVRFDDLDINDSTKTADSPTANNDEMGAPPCRERTGAAGALSSNLQSIFAGLRREARARIIPILDAHAIYLSQLEDLSLNRMQSILDDMQPVQRETRPPSDKVDDDLVQDTIKGTTSATANYRGASMAGPGMFLTRWQQLLDETVITPETIGGPTRRGKDVKHKLAKGKTHVLAKDAWDPEALVAMVERDGDEGVKAPLAEDRAIFEVLGEKFRGLVRDLLRRADKQGRGNKL